MQFVLQAGLQLRHGARVLQVVRELPESSEFLLEDTMTKGPLCIKRSKLIDSIYKQTYQVVVSPREAEMPAAQRDWILDLESLEPAQRQKLELRLDLVKAAAKARITKGQREQIVALIDQYCKRRSIIRQPSASSVMSWIRKYEQSGGNVVALIDGHRFRCSPTRVDPVVENLIWETLRQEYFTFAKNSLVHAQGQLNKRIKLAVFNGEIAQKASYVSYPTLARRVASVDLYHRTASREGAARARVVCRTTFPDGVAEYPMQRAEIDHTPLNWVVVCDRTGLPLGRPTLTILIDAYSGYVLGFYLSFYGAGVTSVCGVMRNALLPKDDIVAAAGLKYPWLSCGLVDEIVCDNGMEFHSFAFKTIGMTLGIDITYARVRTPWIKPHVERFFGTLDTLTLVKGRISPAVADVARIDPYKDACILFSDLVQGLLMYIVNVHPHQPNWRKMATPFELFSEGIHRAPPAIFPGSLKEFNLASGMSKEATLDQGGVQLNGIPYGSYAFKDIVRKHGHVKVLCRWDPDDIGTINVRAPGDLRWHEASCRWPQYASGLSYNQHKIIRAHARVRLSNPEREDALEASKLDLHEHWLNATSKRKRTDAMQAARFSGVSSARVLTNQPLIAPTSPAPPPRIVLDEDFLTAQHAVIPQFESFVMSR